MGGYLLPSGQQIDLGTLVHYRIRLERVAERRQRRWETRETDRQGVVVGVRTLWDGEIEWEEGLAFYWTDPRRAVLISWSMHRRPDLVPFDYVQLLGSSSAPPPDATE